MFFTFSILLHAPLPRANDECACTCLVWLGHLWDKNRQALLGPALFKSRFFGIGGGRSEKLFESRRSRGEFFSRPRRFQKNRWIWIQPWLFWFFLRQAHVSRKSGWLFKTSKIRWYTSAPSIHLSNFSWMVVRGVIWMNLVLFISIHAIATPRNALRIIDVVGTVVLRPLFPG